MCRSHAPNKICVKVLEELNMAVMSRPCNIPFIIKQNKVKQFEEEMKNTGFSKEDRKKLMELADKMYGRTEESNM
jgi:hypothetical protein